MATTQFVTGPGPSQFPGGFLAGLTVRGMPLTVAHPGNVYWVYNGTALGANQIGGADQGTGLRGGGTFNKPFASLNYAISQCKANRGDIIMIKPGHAETISSATALVPAIAGVAVVGLGQGALRPTFTLDTATTTTIQIQASQLTFYNLLFVANFAAIVTCFNVANAQVAKDLTIDNCEFRDKSTVLNFLAAVKVGTTANIADGFTFTNNKVFCLPTAGNTNQAITLASVTDRLNVSGNYVVSAATSAQTPVLLGLGTSLNHTNLLISKNMVVTPTTDSTNGSAVGGSGTMSGLAADNYIANLDNTASIWIPTGLGIMYVQNFSHITAAVDKNALINPSAV